MLDRLVESSNHRNENRRRGGFLLSTLLVVTAIFMSGILWSLFAKDLTMNAGEFELSALIAPVPVTNDEPKPPLPQIEKQASNSVREITRLTNMARVDEAQFVPKDVSTAPNTEKARPVGRFKVERDGIDSNPGAYSGAFNPNGSPTGSGLGSGNETSSSEASKPVEIPPPPPILKKETPKPPVELRKSLGVINGIAVNLVKPVYTAAAKAVRAEGAVNVQVTIDERGNIVAANAVSGHPMLRQASEQAALASKFKPTLLSNQPVKATGIIVYKFALQ